MTNCQMCKGQSSAGCQYCNPQLWTTIPITQTPLRGWECPKCLQVFNPWINKCDKCGVIDK